MKKQEHSKVGFASDFPVEEATFAISGVSQMSTSVIDKMVQTFNSLGFFILKCAPASEPRDNLLALAPFFGRVVPHNRSDRHGVLSVNAKVPKVGFIDSMSLPHPLHTDGAFKDHPEKVIALQCVVPAERGGTSLLSSGKRAHDTLALEEREPLYAADAISIQRNDQCSTKPVFKRLDDHIEMCFRLDDTAETKANAEAQSGLGALKRTLDDQQLSFDMTPHEILVIDNTAIAHGREAFPENSSRHYNRLNFDGHGLLPLSFGFN